MIWTIPNFLTATRLVLTPFVAWRLAVHDVQGAFWLFAVAALTDLLDGNLARLLNQRSVLGAWLDPIADKVMLLTTLSMLCLTDLLPMWLLWVVLVRDLVILAGAEGYRRLTGGLDVRPTLSGKLAIALEFLLVSFTLADLALQLGLDHLIEPFAQATAAVVAVSGLRYVWLWGSKTRAYLRSHADG
ncbi:MAG: CDP-diacylglycerol--glycerol-3-phosphate 3-phosphatidyltransferase [bacterium]|nr:MAG: CDP-diacylglycerol--glycerol-3-phosphate 3-phosphatidyltransferase [bacterium]KAF0147799.1 MAG: CDP-diacylglycerol--glycerol-3-phosphate 3-phosphatidyltransferase [bacterium]KAF0167880.1 MAG: CDP-diacylglycerol--glycerol-3-phosphate 3-phosphatidyltransferase [bacterium]TXT18911.1 MAG: CDP-diacylglycerol--glycerol-3-phosphate 3-phosphatidyltransferase [bacterium]